MHHPLVSRRRAKVFSVALFLIGLAIISYLHTWWPAIMLVLGLPLAFRQYLLGRFYDMVITLFVFVGVFVGLDDRLVDTPDAHQRCGVSALMSAFASFAKHHWARFGWFYFVVVGGGRQAGFGRLV